MEQAVTAEDYFSDEDGPPPLDDMSQHLEKLGLVQQPSDDLPHMAAACERKRAKANVDDEQPLEAPACKDEKTLVTSLRRGFFDTPKKKAVGGTAGRNKENKTEEVVVIKKKLQGTNGPHIPDYLLLKQGDDPLARLKKNMMDAMQPTPALMAEVMARPEIMAGLDDPQIMSAVAEVAKDPSAIKKYSNNPKIVQFYAKMGSLMAERLQN